MYKACVYDTGKLEYYSILGKNVQKGITTTVRRSTYKTFQLAKQARPVRKEFSVWTVSQSFALWADVSHAHICPIYPTSDVSIPTDSTSNESTNKLI
jgi:hypothetical protein